MYLSLGSENPSTLWLGTTWQKQEGRFLLGSSGSYALGATGGASTVQLAVANLPSHTHSASQSAHTHSQPTHKHIQGTKEVYDTTSGVYGDSSKSSTTITYPSGRYEGSAYWKQSYTSSSGGDTTGSSTPSISVGSTGSGTAFSILPPYLVVNIWKRLS